MLLFVPFKNSKWPPAEVKVCIETLWETTFSSSSKMAKFQIKFTIPTDQLVKLTTH
jgi:hypothetical protein